MGHPIGPDDVTIFDYRWKAEMLTEPAIQASRGWASKAIKTQSWYQNQFNKLASWKLVLDEIHIIFFWLVPQDWGGFYLLCLGFVMPWFYLNRAQKLLVFYLFTLYTLQIRWRDGTETEFNDQTMRWRLEAKSLSVDKSSKFPTVANKAK